MAHRVLHWKVRMLRSLDLARDTRPVVKGRLVWLGGEALKEKRERKNKRIKQSMDTTIYMTKG